MRSVWPMSTNTQFLSFFLFHAPSFILLLYCTFEIKSHVNAIHFISIRNLMPFVKRCGPFGFAWSLCNYTRPGSRPPADPALILPPISFNKLTQAQTWDNSSYSVPSEGDSDNGRWLCTSSSMFSWMSQWMYWTFLYGKLERVVFTCMLDARNPEQAREVRSRKVHANCELFPSS